jgi:hypothetical protein
MTGPLFRALLWALGAAAVAGVMAAARPGDRPLVLDVYLLFVGGLTLLLLVHATRTALPAGGRSAFERALRRGERPAARPEELRRLESEVVLATETAFDLHYRLRPVLREIATHRVSMRRGIDLDANPEAARPLVGPAAWDLVRPDREPPTDRLGPGSTLAEVTAAVDALERI